MAHSARVFTQSLNNRFGLKMLVIRGKHNVNFFHVVQKPIHEPGNKYLFYLMTDILFVSSFFPDTIRL